MKTYHPACVHSQTGLLMLQRQTLVSVGAGVTIECQLAANCDFFVIFDNARVLHLCRRVGCCSTATGVQGCSRWWLGPAAHNQAGRRSSVSPQPGKKPFHCSACWWRLRRGSCKARTSQLPGGKKSDMKKT